MMSSLTSCLPERSVRTCISFAGSLGFAIASYRGMMADNSHMFGAERADVAKAFGVRLRMAARQQEKSQRSIAEALDVSTATVNAWFTGKSLPSAQHLRELAGELGVTVEYLQAADGLATTAGPQSPEYLRVYRELMEFDSSSDPAAKQTKLDEIAEYIRYIRSRKARRGGTSKK